MYYECPPVVPLHSFSSSPKEAIAKASRHNIRQVQLASSMNGLEPNQLSGSALKDLKATLRRYEVNPAGFDLVQFSALASSTSGFDRAMDLFQKSRIAMASLGVKKISIRVPEIEVKGIETLINDIDSFDYPPFPVWFDSNLSVKIKGFEIGKGKDFISKEKFESFGAVRVYASLDNNKVLVGTDDFFNVMQALIALHGFSSVVAIPSTKQCLQKILEFEFLHH